MQNSDSNLSRLEQTNLKLEEDILKTIGEELDKIGFELGVNQTYETFKTFNLGPFYFWVKKTYAKE